MNTRRQLLVAFGAGALAAPLASFAQQQRKIWRVGFLSIRNRLPVSFDTDYYGALPRGLRELGYIEGQNLVIEWRLAGGEYDRLPGLAAELVRLKSDVIVAQGTPATRAAQKATAAIPIIMATVADPVGDGFAASLARPGGNITGLSNLTPDMSAKHLEMLLSVAPKLSKVAVLVNPANSSNATVLRSVQSAARNTRVRIVSVEAHSAPEIATAFSSIVGQSAGAVIVAADSFFIQQVRQIAELAAKNRLPSVSVFREGVEAGGLMSYGPNLADMYRRVATYVDKILKGAKPGDLPIEQPTTFELIINGKTAKALNLTIPKSILVRADKVIE